MRGTVPWLASVVVAFCAPSPALAQSVANLSFDSSSAADDSELAGFYLSISGLYGEAQQELGDVLDPIWGSTVAFGYNFEATPLALEVELAYETADLDVPGLSGDATSLEIMVNLRLDFVLHDRLDFYIGGGIGWADQEVDVGIPGLGLAVTADVDGFAYQLRAGLSHPISENIDLYAGVRYIVFEDIELPFGLGDIDNEIVAFEMGLRIHF